MEKQIWSLESHSFGVLVIDIEIMLLRETFTVCHIAVQCLHIKLSGSRYLANYLVYSICLGILAQRNTFLVVLRFVLLGCTSGVGFVTICLRRCPMHCESGGA